MLIGLTGNIGTGKSTVGALLAERGAFVLDADLVYRDLIEPDRPGWRAVVELFGEGVLAADRRIDRAKLGSIVFRDAEQLRRLERATHPLVLARIDDLVAARGAHVAVHEAIKLIESGAADRCDEVWVVTAPRDVQIERLMLTRGLSREDATLRIDAQPPQAEKTARADVVLVNDGDMAALHAAVDREWERVRATL